MRIEAAAAAAAETSDHVEGEGVHNQADAPGSESVDRARALLQPHAYAGSMSTSVPPFGKLSLGRSGSRMLSLSEQLAELTCTEALAGLGPVAICKSSSTESLQPLML